MGAPLITLDQLKIAAGESTAASPKDAQYNSAITSASELVRSYTGLKFEVVDVNIAASERRFEYDASGYLDIDEAYLIDSVTVTPGYSGSTTRTLTVDEWGSYPLNSSPKFWLRMSDTLYGGISPEMGFTYNLDTLYWKLPLKPNVVGVTAKWGWPDIPADVQQATLWTALSIADTAKPYNQESIADYSRTRGADVVGEAIPERAQVALLPYIIPRV